MNLRLIILNFNDVFFLQRNNRDNDGKNFIGSTSFIDIRTIKLHERMAINFSSVLKISDNKFNLRLVI